MFLFMAALLPDFSRALNTWSGAEVLLRGLCHCHHGLGPGFGCDMNVAEKGLFYLVFSFLGNYFKPYEINLDIPP